MLDKLQTLLSALARIMAWLAGLALVAMVALVVVDVVGRQIFPTLSVHGAVELVVILLVMVGFFGLPQAFDRNGHLNVEVATAAAPERLRRGLDLLWSLVGAATAGFLCWMALDTGLYLQATGQVSEILRIKPLVPYGLATTGLALGVLAAANAALRLARGQHLDRTDTDL